MPNPLLLLCCPGPASCGMCCKALKECTDPDEAEMAAERRKSTGSGYPGSSISEPLSSSVQGGWRPKTVLPEDGRSYEGQWVGDVRHGAGKETSQFGDFSYEGNFKNGKYDGEGTMSWANGAKYIGQFLRNQKHGQGVEHYSSGEKFKGEYRDGQINGKGEYFFEDGTSVKGLWKNGSLVTRLASFSLGSQPSR